MCTLLEFKTLGGPVRTSKITKKQIENLEFSPEQLTISATNTGGNLNIFVTLPNEDVLELGEFYSLMQRKLDNGGSIPTGLLELYSVIQKEWKKSAN
jgi:hypothetical protein